PEPHSSHQPNGQLPSFTFSLDRAKPAAGFLLESVRKTLPTDFANSLQPRTSLLVMAGLKREAPLPAKSPGHSISLVNPGAASARGLPLNNVRLLKLNLR